MFYKIVLGTTIVDAQQTLRYVMWQEANQLLLSCDVGTANGILSSDDSVVWHLDGLPAFPEGSQYETVKAVEIDEAEYNELKEKLGQGSVDDTGGESGGETVLDGKASTELLLKVQSLTEEVNTLKSNNEMLSDCLLEMSEIVYA